MYLILRGFALALVASVLIITCKCDDSPGFFLKISKNIPRLGRRSDSSFLKNIKTIPRIGRSDEDNMYASMDKFYAWLNNIAPTINKRVLLNPATVAAANEGEYSVVQPINTNVLLELLNQNALPSDSVRFVHWKDFDRALQTDLELFSKVSMLGRKPDDRLKEDLNYNMAVVSTTKSNEFAPQYMYYNKGADNMNSVLDKYNRNLNGYNYL